MNTVPLRKLAKVIRSKNSGPFELTFDVIFDDQSVYEKVKASGALNREGLAKTYNVDVSDVVAFMFFDPALAFKMTLRRNWGQGTTAERDTFGAQQYAPLLDVEVPFSSNW
ncbi:DUF4387 domain-containing protein [Bradyrhizobium sp. WSM 1704]|uniref:DUF4387 domain-containing protein n=1 Tax=Bradyrhizobium semiaridum TaxID=2821404 RepID=UPI001CE2E503|nr:DUF4387 domain-containing protein [Bradyrhizobium semiaridum]MCA6123166.1 DUF4387 domain-containing protein [Bradyrhizobium semiaridum]